MTAETPTTRLTSVDSTRSSRTQDDHLDEALERVYQKYGSDLSAFLRDVTDEMSSKQQVKMEHRSVRLHR